MEIKICWPYIWKGQGYNQSGNIPQKEYSIYQLFLGKSYCHEIYTEFVEVSSSKDGKWLTRQNECYVKTSVSAEPMNAARLNIFHGSNDRKETDLQQCDDGRETEATKRARLPPVHVNGSELGQELIMPVVMSLPRFGFCKGIVCPRRETHPTSHHPL